MLNRPRIRMNRLILPVFCLAIAGYFGYHGQRAHSSFERMSVQVDRLEIVLKAARTKRKALQHRVGLLRPESLDPDMLGERARQAVNLVHPDDVVVYFGRQ